MGLFNKFKDFIRKDDDYEEDYYDNDEDYYDNDEDYDDEDNYVIDGNDYFEDEDYDDENFFSGFKRKFNSNKTKERSSSIKGVYEYYDYDPNGNFIKMYCIVRSTLFGKIKYQFTDNDKIADAAIGQYYTDMGLASNAIDPHISYNLKDSKEVYDWIKKNNETNNEGLDISIEDFAKDKFAFEKKYYKPTLKLDSEFAVAEASETKTTGSDSETISDSDNESQIFGEDDIKDKFDMSKVKKNAIRVAIASLAGLIVVGAGFAISKYHGPTSNGSKQASTLDDNNDKDKKTDDSKAKEIDNTLEEEQAVEEVTNTMEEDSVANDVVETTVVTGSEYDGNYVNDDNTSNDYYQDPVIPTPPSDTSTPTTPGSVNDSYGEFQDPNASIDDSTEDTQPSPDEDEDYGNIIEEEPPVDTGEDNSGSDEDYSEEIDVPAGDEIIFDDEYEDNQGAIDGDYGFDEELNDGEMAPLPNPDDTASDGDYISTDDQLEQSDSSTIVESEETIETVPVEQVVDAAIAAMENGEDVTIAINEDNTVSVEQVPVEQTYEANSMTR